MPKVPPYFTGPVGSTFPLKSSLSWQFVQRQNKYHLSAECKPIKLIKIESGNNVSLYLGKSITGGESSVVYSMDNFFGSNAILQVF